VEHTLAWLVRSHGRAIREERRADFHPSEPAFLGRVATQIVNEIRNVNRVDLRLHQQAAGDDPVGVAFPSWSSFPLSRPQWVFLAQYSQVRL
jgi:hypothetical protein